MNIYRFTIGLAVVLAVFAVKAGVGLYCGVVSRSKKYQKVILTLGFPGVYLVVFVAFCYFWKNWGWSSDFRYLLDFARYGTDVHFVVSTGLIVWGVGLLKSSSDGKFVNDSAWLALIIPCPICLMVIFFTMGFVEVYFPASLWKMVGISSGFFVGTAFLTFFLVGFIERRKGNLDPQFLVAATMIVTASYTLLTLLFGSGVKEAFRIYNIVANKEVMPGNLSIRMKFAIVGVCAFIFLGSFVFTVYHNRKKTLRLIKEHRP